MTSGTCPFGSKKNVTAAGVGQTNRDWWPNMLNLRVLRQHSELVNPMGQNFNYAQEFNALDLPQVKQDLIALMTDSQPWWPADYGHYGPFFIRMAWHVAGTYRTADGRGGACQGLQRFAPTNSWPDNANLDKARRLLWPIKQKFGRRISWADLFILAGNCAHESMGLKPFGFGGGREDIWEAAEDIYWGTESTWLGNVDRFSESTSKEKVLEKPLAAVHMGLIYVNPEGPNGEPDPLKSAHDIRETFGRMAMDDRETVALIAGGHTFGKCHGAASASHVGPEPNAAPLEAQGFGWHNSHKTGKGIDTITSGLEGAWTPAPTKWDTGYFDMLLGYEWKLGKSPAGAHQWYAQNVKDQDLAPEVDGSAKVQTIMATTDIALKEDPLYRQIAEEFHKDHQAFTEAYQKAWFKLTHRDMGPISRYLGPDVPQEVFLWQDPLPSVKTQLITAADQIHLKEQLLQSQVESHRLIAIAWNSAASFRQSDKRGGANGARLRLAPQSQWMANEPKQLARDLLEYERIQAAFNAVDPQKQVSIADLIVLGGAAAIESAVKATGHSIAVPFTPGRVDATSAHIDVESFAPMEPETDGFRNFAQQVYSVPSEALLIDKAQLLSLTAPEMTVLVGGMRVLDANHNRSQVGVLTKSPGQLTPDFFVNLLDMTLEWQPIDEKQQLFQAVHRDSGSKLWTASRVDLIFGHNPELRAIAEVYASEDAQEKFMKDFIAAWHKVMELDLF